LECETHLNKLRLDIKEIRTAGACAELRREIPEYAKRNRVKPGLTGLAQVNLEYDSCVDTVRAKLEYDLEYIRRRSLLEDLKIMLKTVPVILFRKGGW
jgi:lipopolysaccharide/colanic/teichoic acid biosynthesis glycosyltransferase